MRALILLGLSTLCLSAFLVVTAQAQQDPPDAPTPNSASTQRNTRVIEGIVVSATRHTLTVRSDDDQYHLFTYPNGMAHQKALTPGTRVRVDGSTPDNGGTQVAEKVDVMQPAGNPGSTNNSPDGGDPAQTGRPQAAPPPPQVRHVTNEIEHEARRWHGGGRVGFGFSPELFMFGLQSQIGPVFNRRFLLRPNAEFGFGELTDMFALNLEGAYRLRTTFRGRWDPYIGMGPSLNFIHQGASSGDVSFSNFSYKTGFNVFVGGEKGRTFVEMKTSLWSGEAPVLRLFVGYNF